MAKTKPTPHWTVDPAEAKLDAELTAERRRAWRQLIVERDEADARAAAANVECAKWCNETQLLKKENARLTAEIVELKARNVELSDEREVLRVRLQSSTQYVAKVDRALAMIAIEYSELGKLHDDHLLENCERLCREGKRLPG